MKKTNFKRLLSVSLIISLVIPTALVTTNIFRKKDVQASVIQNKEDERIAIDISNMTGLMAEDILRLRKSGNTWESVLDMLRNKTTGLGSGDISKRSTLLADTGLGSEFVEKCKAEGFEEKEITSAKMLVERVVFQLKEITQEETAMQSPLPNTDKLPLDKQIAPVIGFEKAQGSKEEQAEDILPYRDLIGKIDIKTAVYLILKLNKELGGMEKVLEEYLYAIQVGVNLELYLIDKKGYEKEKEEKSRWMDTQKLLTLARIEAKMLDRIKLQNDHSKNQTGLLGDNLFISGKSQEEAKPYDDLAKVLLPDVGMTRPKDPAADVMKEINDIRNKSLNLEGR